MLAEWLSCGFSASSSLGCSSSRVAKATPRAPRRTGVALQEREPERALPAPQGPPRTGARALHRAGEWRAAQAGTGLPVPAARSARGVHRGPARHRTAAAPGAREAASGRVGQPDRSARGASPTSAAAVAATATRAAGIWAILAPTGTAAARGAASTALVSARRAPSTAAAGASTSSGTRTAAATATRAVA